MVARPSKPIELKYDLQRIYAVRDKQKLYTSQKYLGQGMNPPTILRDVVNAIESGIELDKTTKAQLSRDVSRIRRLSSPYQKVAERELARMAVEDFLFQLDRNPKGTLQEQKNIEDIKKTVANWTQEQKESFLRGVWTTDKDGKRVLKAGYQDPRTVTLPPSKRYDENPTQREQMRKAYGKNGYMVQRVQNIK